MIYLDYAASTPLDPQALKSMQPYWRDQFFNPSANHLAAKKVSQAISQARVTVAGILGARPAEIIFTAGGTEADNLAINGVMQSYPKANLIVSAIEHQAVLQTAQKYSHKLAPVNRNGLVDVAKLADLIDDNTVLVSVMYANNELGTVQPLAQISQTITKIKGDRQKRAVTLPLYLHTDASQAGNCLNLQVSRLGVDLMTLNGGKIYGPKQTGGLFVKAGIELTPILRGGGQERNLRSGTENVPGIIGFARALEVAQTMRHAEVTRLTKLQAEFEQLLAAKIPTAIINNPKNRLPNFIHLTIPGVDNERLMMELDEQAIVCAAGSACRASDDEPSHVLKAIGLSDADAQSSLRFSLGRPTSLKDIKNAVSALHKLLTTKS
jgi:cysteine desulfurase